MSRETATYYLIIGYLNGALTKEELLSVEKRIKEDVNFKNYLESHQKANQIIVLNEENKIKNTLARIHKKATLRKIIFKYSLIAIMFILLIGVIVFLNIEGENNNVLDGKNQTINTFVKLDKKDTLFIENEELQKTVKTIVENVKRTESNDKEKPEIIKDRFDYLDSVDRKEALPIVIDTLNKKIELNLNEEGNFSSKERLLSPDENKTSVHDCDIYDADIALETSSTCYNKSEGVLNITTNKESYSYSMDGGFTIQKEFVFLNLKSGKYTLVAFDINKCKSEPIDFEIESKKCDFMIQPERSIFWEINLEEFSDDEVELEIYSAKSGQKVIQRILSTFELNTWNGEAQNGEILPMGSYVYILSSYSKSERGSITIVQ